MRSFSPPDSPPTRRLVARGLCPSRGASWRLALSILAALTVGCGGPDRPIVGDAWKDDQPRRVLVFVPGITGSVLRHQDGSVAWGRGSNLIKPRDGGHALAVPIAGEAVRPLHPDGLLMKMRLLFLKKAIYQPLVDLFLHHGYRLGDLEAPAPHEDLYLFAYDWRQDNIRSAQELAAALERVRRARGEERLAIDLVCQSNGGSVCRWLARFGSATLEAAEAGDAGPPAMLDVHQVVMVGTANGGSIRTLREMTRGRRYVPWIGRRFEPEIFFTITAFFQDLPSYRDDLFVDLAGQPVDTNIFSADDWRRYGWSIYGDRAARSLAKRRPSPMLFGDDSARAAHLDAMLDRAQRLAHTLAGDSPVGDSTRYHLIQNVSWDTADRAVLAARPGGGFDLLFSGDKALRKQPTLHAAVTALGDGHATRASQLYLGSAERAALSGDVFSVVAEHFETILQAEAHRRLLEILAGP